MPRFHITRRNRIILWVLLSLFAAFNLAAALGSEGFGRALLTALGTPLGPLTGAISRDFQPCCLKFSLSLLPLFLPLLLVGILTQFRRDQPASLPLRFETTHTILWASAWALWFFSGFISFAHALN